MLNKKHILFTTAWYPHKFDNMWGLFVQRHAEAAALYHAVSVLYIHGCEQKKLQKEFITENNITTLRIYYRKLATPFKPLTKLINIFFYFYYTYIGYRLLVKQQGRPHLIHVNILTRAGTLPFLFKKMQ